MTRLQLGHALAQWSAERTGARVLHIKGLAAQAVLPLAASGSTDVDVLVEPERHADVVDLLSGRESVDVNDAATHSTEAHAVELVSTALGVAVDVHRRFPGFRASAAETFEELWSRSEEIELAGWTCRVHDRVGAALIGLVHAARNPEGSRSAVAALARWEQLDEGERSEVRHLVERLGAQAAVHVVLGGYPAADRWEVALYRAHRSRARPVTLWWLTFMSQPDLSGRWDVARRAVRSRVDRGRLLPLGSLRGSVRESLALVKGRHG